MGGSASSITTEIYMQAYDHTAITTALHPLKRNNGEISVLVYRKPTHTDQYLHYSSHHQTSYKESVVSPLFHRAYSIIKNKDMTYTKKSLELSKC